MSIERSSIISKTRIPEQRTSPRAGEHERPLPSSRPLHAAGEIWSVCGDWGVADIDVTIIISWYIIFSKKCINEGDHFRWVGKLKIVWWLRCWCHQKNVFLMKEMMTEWTKTFGKMQAPLVCSPVYLRPGTNHGWPSATLRPWWSWWWGFHEGIGQILQWWGGAW